MKYNNIREEELKNRVANDVFWNFDCSSIIGYVDFCVKLKSENDSLYEEQFLLWAEAKKNIADMNNSISQLVLTIGKARTFDKYLPPPFLGAFDYEKISFVPYNEVADIFYLNDFNWNVAPSDYSTKEFKLVHDKVSLILEGNSYTFDYENDEKQLQKFIRLNFLEGKFGVSKIKIDKNNFMVIYNKWVNEVKDSILVNWDKAKTNGIIDGDFYLADILSENNKTIKDKLYVILNINKYELDRKIDESGFDSIKSVGFRDGQKAHTQFWNKYQRPPIKEYWEYIVSRRDLLVPQDIRERKGSFYTPQIWVELSQKYITDVLGEDWQDEYYVWDCAAGTGNLLAGLTNKYNIWASTLDKQDVDVMHDRIDNGANLLKSHVFQFDFLNDDFTELPEGLQEIINDPEKRKKLVVYINPPYAEAGSYGHESKVGVSKDTKINKKYSNLIGQAINELFIQFFIRIYSELKGVYLCEFSKTKFIQGGNFYKFREIFKTDFKKGFIVPAKTFDNVKGIFPIGFLIFDTSTEKRIDEYEVEIFESNSEFKGMKRLYTYDNEKGKINDWLKKYYDKSNEKIGILHNNKNDFQTSSQVRITIEDNKDHTTPITVFNLVQMCMYLTLRHIIEATWINDRDQFLYPNDKWEKDIEFQNDCLAFTLFDSQNRITSWEGTNHWIPFSEEEVGAKDKFESSFMSDFIRGRIKVDDSEEIFGVKREAKELEFSEEARNVFDAGRELWRYYHSREFDVLFGGKEEVEKGVKKGEMKPCDGVYNVNASLYDIREYFQGRSASGRMKSSSEDKEYMRLIKELRERLKDLGRKLEPKVYEYGFLRK